MQHPAMCYKYKATDRKTDREEEGVCVSRQVGSRCDLGHGSLKRLLNVCHAAHAVRSPGVMLMFLNHRPEGSTHSAYC